MRRKEVNANMVRNGDFENAPPFVAPTSTSVRWIDGTAAGSTMNPTYGWGVICSGGGSAMFDPVEKKNGLYSLKLMTNPAGGGYAEATNYGNQPNLTQQVKWAIPCKPNTSYTFSCWMKTEYVSGDSTAGARVDIVEHHGNSVSQIATRLAVPVTKLTQGWTYYTYTWTTSATARLLRVKPLVHGHNGAATLVMNAWFDEITIKPTAPVTRRAV